LVGNIFVSGFSCVQNPLTAAIICKIMLVRLIWVVCFQSRADFMKTVLSTFLISPGTHGNFPFSSQFNAVFTYLHIHPHVNTPLVPYNQHLQWLWDLADHFSLMTKFYYRIIILGMLMNW
jgi:hypothetical protein